MPIRTQFGPFSIIVALDECGGFAKDGKIPWVDEPQGKEDLKHFQQITKGGICIMGRNTYDDLLRMMLKRKKIEDIEDILPNRTSFVVTSRGGETRGAQKVFGLRDVIHELQDTDRREIFILGGYRLFVESMPFVNRIYVTLFPGDYRCDSHFPINSFGKFRIVAGDRSGDLKFINYQRTG
jgi:dihydrofolate reductase